ncbi:MAG TPA: DUF4234 domain-containing protein [Syntrophorhabdaceae bacterium]|nr:DUF4234 domain-containing protein [Syntrophorhabdaceae bacterium]
MQCKNCGHDNPEESRFCMKCGKEMAETGTGGAKCTHCGAENIEGALFCVACGKSIGAPYSGDVSHGRTYEAPGQNIQNGPFTSNIALDVVLSIITCGIYWFFWQARQMRAINHLLGQQRYNFWLWFLLTLVTCGLFNIYYEYYMAQGINEAQGKYGKQLSRDLPVLSLILTILGLNIVADAIQQNEINKIFGQ